MSCLQKEAASLHYFICASSKHTATTSRMFPAGLTQLMVLSSIILVQANYILHVRVHSYSNPTNKCPQCRSVYRSQSCCDNIFNTGTCTGEDRCDLNFFYCLRAFGRAPASTPSDLGQQCGANNNRLGRLSDPNIDDAEVDFSKDMVLGLPNPIPLQGITLNWERVQLYVEVTDSDYTSSDDFVDEILIDIESLAVGVETEPNWYNGTFGYTSLLLSFKVECFRSHYFPTCGANNCQNTGNCTCFPGFTGEGCAVDIDECLDVTCPSNSKCVDGIDSYSCTCLDGFSGENCTIMDHSQQQQCDVENCNGNGVCVSSGGCDCESGYTGSTCQTKIDDLRPSFSSPFDMSHMMMCVVTGLVVLMVVAILSCIQFRMIRMQRRANMKALRENDKEQASVQTNISKGPLISAPPPPSATPAAAPKVKGHTGHAFSWASGTPVTNHRNVIHYSPTMSDHMQLEPVRETELDNQLIISYPTEPQVHNNSHKTTVPSVTPKPGKNEGNNHEQASTSEVMAEQENIPDKSEWGEAIPTEVNPGYNCNVDQSNTASQQTNTPTQEYEHLVSKFVEGEACNCPAHLPTALINTDHIKQDNMAAKNGKSKAEVTIPIGTSYSSEQETPTQEYDDSVSKFTLRHENVSENSESDAEAILTEMNPGYNCPSDTSYSSKQQATTPTQEYEHLVSKFVDYPLQFMPETSV